MVLDQAKEFYPPASAWLGIDLDRLIVVQPASMADNLWALDQSLRCPGVAVVLAWPERLDPKTFRRLQLAAEQGGGLGFLLRPEGARHEPSWADVRLWVEPTGKARNFPTCANRRSLKIEMLRSRGGASGRSVELEIDDETRTVHLASRLAHPAAGRRAAGA